MSKTDDEITALENVLYSHGFRRCDIPVCNCGSWHQRFGLRQRMDELKAMLSDAGYPLCNENGNLISNALAGLIAAHDRLEAEASALKATAARYETLRRLNPRQFTDLFNRNLAGEPFDSMVDEMSKENP